MCKCGAKTMRQHLANIRNRVMGAHVYTGFIWLPRGG